MPKLRIVSLIASSTEIVCALGGEDWLVGRSHERDFPESVQRLPVCTATKFVTDGNQYFNRPGPRLLESLEILTEIFYPKIFSFSHAGTGWQLLMSFDFQIR